MAIEHRHLEVHGLRTFYQTAGSGHPVVMIHGGAPGVCSLVAWKLNMEPLAASGLCLYAFDQPGFGNTDNPTDYSMDYRVAHARKFIDALGLERFHLLGNSMGAYIAARIALEDPRAGRLVLISSGTLSPPGSAAAVAQGKETLPGVAGIHPFIREHAGGDPEDPVQERAGYRRVGGGTL